jgi:hypothetical protein
MWASGQIEMTTHNGVKRDSGDPAARNAKEIGQLKHSNYKYLRTRVRISVFGVDVFVFMFMGDLGDTR